jgi:nitroreductase
MMDTIALNKLIADRRSVYPKQYNGVPVDDDIVNQMLENANWAPSHGLTEPWRFVVFTGEALGRLADFFQQVYKETTPSENFDEGKYQKQRESILKSSHVLAIIMKRQETGKIPEIEEVCAVASAVQNMWLTASAYGVGCYWSTGGPTFKLQGKAYFGLGEQDKLLGFMYIGNYDGELPAGRRKPIVDKLKWER